MDRPWLASYPPGMPARIESGAVRSLAHLFLETVDRFGGRPAFTGLGRTLSFEELEERSRAFAAFAQKDLGLRPGDRLVVMLPNLLQYPVVLFGALRAGLVLVNTNPLYTPRELVHQLRDSGATAAVVLENVAHVLAGVLPETDLRSVVVTGVGDLLGRPRGPLVNFALRHFRGSLPRWSIPGCWRLGEALARGGRQSLDEPRLGPEDLAFLQYTGGTTGVSKAAELTHGNVASNVLQARTWLAPVVEPGSERVVAPLPLYHVFGLNANALTFFSLGAENLLIADPRDLKTFVRALRGAPFSFLVGVSTLFNRLLATPGFERLDFGRCKRGLAGAMAVQASVAERWQRVTGTPILQAYGLTEASPAAAMNRLDSERFSGTVGLPLPSTDVAIRSREGTDLPPGEVGELCLRGPQVMRGYWRRPEETQEVLGSDGWLRTGDLASLDETGELTVVDRLKDLIVVSGFNVYPNEVEEVLSAHPGVLEVGVIGVPDERTGEAPKAVVVAREPGLTGEDLAAYCREHLAGYKIPRRFELVAELPKSGVGKVLRRELR